MNIIKPKEEICISVVYFMEGREEGEIPTVITNIIGTFQVKNISWKMLTSGCFAQLLT